MSARVIDWTDVFGRPDAANLGSNYDAGYTGDDPLKIVSNQVQATTIGTLAVETINAFNFLNDQWAQVIIAAFPAGGEDDRVSVVLRSVAPAANTWYEFTAGVHGTTAFSSRLAYRSAGSIIASTTENTTVWANGDVLDAMVVGSALTLSRAPAATPTIFTPLLTLNDSNLTSGRVGFSILAQTLTNVDVSSLVAGHFLVSNLFWPVPQVISVGGAPIIVVPSGFDPGSL